MNTYNLIRQKQLGEVHSSAEIEHLVSSFTDGSLPDYQMAAWLMAVYFKGMMDEERTALVSAMINSGERLDFSYLDGFVADKHSTGGVGDKVSLVLAPIVAACGVYIPMISGRGLGHTGGTLDKLESIPGFTTAIDLPKFKRLVEEVGSCLIGQTGEICPADKKIYALRDVTATVSSIPLICSSIMSKKIAEGIQGLALDVKMGNGAFMTNYAEARALADTLISTGKAFGVETVARITNMSQPLGNAAGIWCEVAESVDVLEGGGPQDLIDLSIILSSDILRLAGIENSEQMATEALTSGRARAKFDEIVAAQGGDPKALNDQSTHAPNHTIPLKAAESGYVSEIDTYRAGMSVITAGAGRKQAGDALDPTAGFILEAKVGDRVEAGDEIGQYFGSDASKVEAAASELSGALTVSNQKIPALELLVKH